MKNNRLIYLLLSIVILWLAILSFSVPRKNQDDTSTNINKYNVSGFSTDFTRVIDENISGVVTINADGTILSGFAYRQDSDTVYILTAYHGVASANNINAVFASTYSVPVSITGYDALCDLAVLKAETPYEVKTLHVGDSTLLSQGEFVISIGTPLSMDYALSCELGMVSKGVLTIDNTITYEDVRYNYYLDVLQLSTDLNSGYSGSPVLNMNGEVVGMNTMDLNGDLNFALTANEMKLVADRIIAGEEVKRNIFGVKGIYVRDMQNYEKSNLDIDIEVISGLYVQRVKENSPALLAGVRMGDIITKINGIGIDGLDSYLNVTYMDYETLVFEVMRGGQTLELVSNND